MRLVRATAFYAALLLAGCASTPEPAPGVDLTGYTLSGLVIPDALPEPGDPLGFLRPDAGPLREDVEVRVEPYRVTGSTPEEILRGADGILSRVKDNGKSFVARVDWRVIWSYDYETRDGLCRAEDVATALTVTYQLPDWQPDTLPSDGLSDYWDAFEDDLWTHEYGHALIGYRAKQDIQTALSEADVADADCDEVGKALNGLGRAIIARGLDAEYDAQTCHGRTQGATSEPPPEG